MSLWSNLISRSRIKSVSRRLAADPSARNYVALAQEHARMGRINDVLRICEEGLESFHGNLELKRLLERSREIQREGRLRELQSDLKLSPRPAVWREFCTLLMEAGRLDRAEECAVNWYAKTKDPEATFFRAKAITQRFFADRRSEDGKQAFALTQKAAVECPDDQRPLELRLELASRCGAWLEARRTLARLLELRPGDPDLESRFRTIMTLSENPKTVEQALRDVEMSGELEGDKPRRRRVSGTVAVRPMLQALSEQPQIKAAFYVRGGTALVQGPRGAQADRSARAIREILQSTRSAARRLGLGQPHEVQLEGEFGHLHCVAGELGSSALWSKRPVTVRQIDSCRELAGYLDTEASS